MKCILYLILVCFLSLPAFSARQTDENDLLNISHQGGPQSITYDGTPFIFIGQTVGKQPDEPLSGWMDEEKKRLFGTTQITKSELLPNGRIPSSPKMSPSAPTLPVLKEMSYKTPFGHALTDVYSPHTTDFIVQIQVIKPETLLIEEHISYIETENKPFQRTLLLNKPARLEDFELLNATIDGQSFTPDITVQQNEITLTRKDFLPAGFHEATLKYLLHDGITVRDKKGFIHYNITGTRWELPVARLAVHISFLNKTTVWEKEILFGTNYVSILNSFNAFSDKQGNMAFTLNNPLPAYANAAVYASFNPQIFPPSMWSDYFTGHPELFVGLVSLSFVLIYLCSVALIYQKPEKNIRRYIYRFSPLTLNRLTNVFPDQKLIADLKNHYRQNHQRMPIECHLHSFFSFLKPVCSLMRYLRLSLQYWITAGFLVFGVIYFAGKQNIYLTFFYDTLIFVLSGLMIFIFFHYIGRQKMLKETKRFQNQLLDSNPFYKLNPTAARALYIKNYPYAAALNFHRKWTNLFQSSNPELSGEPKGGQ